MKHIWWGCILTFIAGGCVFFQDGRQDTGAQMMIGAAVAFAVTMLLYAFCGPSMPTPEVVSSRGVNYGTVEISSGSTDFSNWDTGRFRSGRFSPDFSTGTPQIQAASAPGFFSKAGNSMWEGIKEHLPATFGVMFALLCIICGWKAFTELDKAGWLAMAALTGIASVLMFFMEAEKTDTFFGFLTENIGGVILVTLAFATVVLWFRAEEELYVHGKQFFYPPFLFTFFATVLAGRFLWADKKLSGKEWAIWAGVGFILFFLSGGSVNIPHYEVSVEKSTLKMILLPFAVVCLAGFCIGVVMLIRALIRGK